MMHEQDDHLVIGAMGCYKLLLDLFTPILPQG